MEHVKVTTITWILAGVFALSLFLEFLRLLKGDFENILQRLGVLVIMLGITIIHYYVKQKKRKF